MPTARSRVPTLLRENWYVHVGEDQCDLLRPGVYEWRIEGVGLYVGKAKLLRNRIRAYPRNVRQMMDGHPWHGNPEKEYRPIHEALREAYEKGRLVTLTVLENCDTAKQAAEREQWWIEMRREEFSAGGPLVLNGN